MSLKTLEARFWKYTNKKSFKKCWDWVGFKNASGYGQLHSHSKNGREFTILSHRLSWILHNGPFPKTLCVLHKCDNPHCVNPKHLFLGTRTDNALDKVKKGRQSKGLHNLIKTHCPKGHPYSGDNLLIAKNKNGKNRRACKACIRIWALARYYRLKDI